MNPMFPMIATIAMAVLIVVLIVVLYKYSAKKQKRIREEGFETESVVTRVESRRDDGTTRHYSYVTYTGNDSLEHEAFIYRNFPIGRKIKIRYLPEKYDDVVFVSQDLNTP